MAKQFEKRCSNIHQFTRESALWTEHYRKWVASGRGTPEMTKAHELLDRFTQELVVLFGDPSDAGE